MASKVISEHISTFQKPGGEGGELGQHSLISLIGQILLHLIHAENECEQLSQSCPGTCTYTFASILKHFLTYCDKNVN